MLKEAAPRQGFFDREQLAAVLRHLPDHVQPVVEFCYLTGWRVNSEVLPLEWRQVDFAAGEIRLDPGSTKSGAGRTFPMTAEIRALLEWLDAAITKEQRLRCPNVFQRDGQPIKSIRGAWVATRRKAGLPGKLLHDFRRTAARDFGRAGVPRGAAMAMIGHQTESMYRRYSIQDSATLRGAAARLDRANGHAAGTLGTGTHDDQ
jgi:integrase